MSWGSDGRVCLDRSGGRRGECRGAARGHSVPAAVQPSEGREAGHPPLVGGRAGTRYTNPCICLMDCLAEIPGVEVGPRLG